MSSFANAFPTTRNVARHTHIVRLARTEQDRLTRRARTVAEIARARAVVATADRDVAITVVRRLRETTGSLKSACEAVKAHSVPATRTAPTARTEVAPRATSGHSDSYSDMGADRRSMRRSAVASILVVLAVVLGCLWGTGLVHMPRARAAQPTLTAPAPTAAPVYDISLGRLVQR